MTDLSQLDTPCLVLDLDRLTANAQRMAARCRRHGVDLRPHIKTAKSVPVAQLATQGFSGGITVSTVREAEAFAAAGFTDLTLAVCVVPAKLPRLRGLPVTLLTDNLDVARVLAREPFDVLVEIDCGERRTGLTPEDPLLIQVADALQGRLRGVLTHGGQSYNCRTPEHVARVADQERSAVTRAADLLRHAGLRCDRVSAGSTPTAVQGTDWAGVTDLRPGVYLFGDLFQAGLGSCTVSDIALSVLSTVVSRSGDRVVLDAGGLALSKDRSTRGTDWDAGYGRLLSLEGAPLDAIVADVHQEHGEVHGAPADLRVGDRVRVLPNHACMTGAAYGRYHVVQGTRVVHTWDRVNGW